MNARDIFASANKEIVTWSADDIDVDKSKLGLAGSPTKVKKSWAKEVKGGGELIKRDAEDAASYIVVKLKEKHYI